MSEAKFTPGPWQLSGIRKKFGSLAPGAQYHSVGPELDPVAAVYFDPETGLGRKDAQLIAAAPELYEALAAFVSNSSVQANQPSECEIAEAALAKARGES